MYVLTDRFGNIIHDRPARVAGAEYWAQVTRERKAVSSENLVLAVQMRIQYMHRKADLPCEEKPTVRVFRTKDGRRQTYVLRIGFRFTSASSWRGLMENAAWAPWGDIRKKGMYQSRWK